MKPNKRKMNDEYLKNVGQFAKQYMEYSIDDKDLSDAITEAGKLITDEFIRDTEKKLMTNPSNPTVLLNPTTHTKKPSKWKLHPKWDKVYELISQDNGRYKCIIVTDGEKDFVLKESDVSDKWLLLKIPYCKGMYDIVKINGNPIDILPTAIELAGLNE